MAAISNRGYGRGFYGRTPYGRLTDPALHSFASVTTDIPLAMYEGDTQYIAVAVQDSDGDPVPIQGTTLRFTAKLANDIGRSGDTSAKIRCVYECENDGATGAASVNVFDSDPTAGTVTFRFNAPEMKPKPGAARKLPTKLYYDIQIDMIGGDVRTLVFSTFDISPDVTNTTG